MKDFYFETLSSINILFSGDAFILKLSAVFVFSFLVAIMLSKLLLRTAWFLSVLKKLSHKLWIWFLAAFPFYFSKSVLFFFENPSCMWWEALLVGGSSLFFLFLIRFFYVGRGSDKLYDWLIFNTRIRVALVNFILLSLFLSCYFWEDITTLSSVLSLSVVANLHYLDGLGLPIFVVDILKRLLLNCSFFLFGYLYVIVWLAQAPFVVIISHYLASGVLLRWISLYPSLLELFNCLTVVENNVSTYKLVAKWFNLNVTVPELFGKTVVRTENCRPKGFARSFSSLSKQGILETRISWLHYPQNLAKSYSVLANENLSELTSFLKSQKPFSHWKNFLPFSAIEKKILSLAVSETSLQHKLLVMYVVFESHRTGKPLEEVFISICHQLGFFSGTEEEIRAKLTAYGLSFSALSTLGVHSLNLVDLVNVRELYNYINHLNNSYLPQHLALTGNYLAEYCRSSFFRSLGLFDDLSSNFSKDKDSSLQQHVQLVTEILFQFLRYFPAEYQHLDPSQQSWKSIECQQSILRSGRQMRHHLSLLESKGVQAMLESVEKIRFGDYKVQLSTGEHCYVDVTQISTNASVRIVANPNEINTEDVADVVKLVCRVAIEKYLNNDSQVEMSVNLPLIFADEEEFSALLGKNKAQFRPVLDDAISQKKDIVKALDKSLQQEKSEAIYKQKVGRRDRVSKDIEVLKGLEFEAVLSKISHTTAVTIKK